MRPESESESDFGDLDDDERDDERQALQNAERDKRQRDAMVSRALERKGYWQRELTAERFDEFKPEMRRRIQVEQDLIDGLQANRLPVFVLLTAYHRDAVHRPAKPESIEDTTPKQLADAIAKASRKRRDLEESIRLTPQKQTTERRRLLNTLAEVERDIAKLKGELRKFQ